MGEDVKHTVLVNFSAECSSKTAEKISIGIKKSEWKKLHEPNLTIELFTNKKEKLINILNAFQ
ncbi:MAG: hypothetical protein IPO02_01675 [Bacteroidetes bacterium]|nr:hypothetical protein [Bacteroidota bacterium]